MVSACTCPICPKKPFYLFHKEHFCVGEISWTGGDKASVCRGRGLSYTVGETIPAPCASALAARWGGCPGGWPWHFAQDLGSWGARQQQPRFHSPTWQSGWKLRYNYIDLTFVLCFQNGVKWLWRDAEVRCSSRWTWHRSPAQSHFPEQRLRSLVMLDHSFPLPKCMDHGNCLTRWQVQTLFLLAHHFYITSLVPKQFNNIMLPWETGEREYHCFHLQRSSVRRGKAKQWGSDTAQLDHGASCLPESSLLRSCKSAPIYWLRLQQSRFHPVSTLLFMDTI